MKEILLRELFRNTDQYQDKEVTVRGWIRNNRSSNKFGFIELNDGSFFKSVQVVYEEEFIDNFEEISKAYVASALNVRGVVTLTPGAKQPFEIKAKEITVEATSTPDYPLQPQEAHHGISQGDSSSETEEQHLCRSFQNQISGILRDTQVLPGTELRICAYPDNHWKRR